MNDQLLNVKSLTIEIANLNIVHDVHFSLEKGKVLAIVGESGSGKTTLCRALTRLSPIGMNGVITGNVRFGDTNLLTCNEIELRRIRSSSIRYVFPEPQQALNPVSRIRTQMLFAAHAITESQLTDALLTVDIRNPEEVLNSYPHQLSIGMAQRVLIAMALLPNPVLLIADEPTSAVDASLRHTLLNLLQSQQQQRQMAMIIITHDLEVARKYSDQVAVLLNGQIVEQSDCATFFREPKHPYSQSLLDALPSFSGITKARFEGIE